MEWRGSNGHKYPLSIFFVRRMEDISLFDIHPVNLRTTWRNMRVGQDNISKRLEIFLINEGTLLSDVSIKQWGG